MHDEQIVHLDIKLENVMYDPETKNVVLIDYGCAHEVVDHDEKLNFL
jgi:serine/threonine protein kinase